MKVLDFCAGAGGKTLALAAMMEGEGFLVAHDVDPARLARLEPRLWRSGADRCIRLAKDRDEVERLGPYDVVLVDAPCTSSGTLRRHPDVAWRWDEQSVRTFAETQAAIIDETAQLVAQNGRLIYVTCSLFAAENQCIAEGFLASHPTFAPEPFQGKPWDSIPGASTGQLRLPLHLDDYEGDGFFVAGFVKKRA